MPARRARHPGQPGDALQFWLLLRAREKKEFDGTHLPAEVHRDMKSAWISFSLRRNLVPTEDCLSLSLFWNYEWDFPVAETCMRVRKRGFSSLTVTGSLIIKKGNGERPIERCFLWRNIAARWKKPQTPFVLTFNERDDAFVTDIPLGPSDLQTTEEPDKSECLMQQQAWLPRKCHPTLQHPNKPILKRQTELQFEICNTRPGADRKENTGLCFCTAQGILQSLEKALSDLHQTLKARFTSTAHAGH